ncbi:3-methyl-2-oxobutanoate hydroxymethyltransferase [Halomicronema hongdechloris C2206]|uniref:3-methyl-2-oxobutanoate hydroxymethyltransferase n=1 Tax=Halomicronema hongdechloris C2206 TaxID=1641165 RepID=A0A1Z3HIS6_9CYAN|nr:3-methyl-2-oxobutanoate hydroxymethyltransferase [Halomicronema hongdechloris]ASC70200.1 3-methyl-2-oxobutanoate hydroxymethyltransferase [Halomicronema hongdechloris C2206]
MVVNVHQFKQWKRDGRAIVVLTAWDYMSGQIVVQAGADIVLVGDSLAMVALGYETTLPLTLEEMLHHAKAVRRAVDRVPLVVDMPFLSYQVSVAGAIHSAGRVLQETEATAVKVEGGHPAIAPTIAALVQVGIPVMGHVGLTPQSVNQFGGFRRQGTSAESAQRILEEAKAVEAAGAFCIVLEHIPAELAQQISQTLTIPTIGIGAGAHCDGQVLVTADVLGLSSWQPKFAKAYGNLRQSAIDAAHQFCEEVRTRRFPNP